MVAIVVIRFGSEGSSVDERGGWDDCNVWVERVIAAVDVRFDDGWHCDLRLLLLRSLGPNTRLGRTNIGTRGTRHGGRPTAW